MAAAGIRTLYQGGTGEIVEKKSRFIANVQTIETEEEALAFIAAVKKKYWDARHNCYAFVAGEKHQLQRCSDDGEPQGTAGRPMLDVLLREDIHNAVIVVTRYFGGTLLGTGGLVRAYQKAAQEGLAASVVIEKQKGELLTICTDYNGIGKIQYILAQQGITVVEAVYEAAVELQVMVPLEEMEELLEKITEGTNGAARFCHGNQREYGVIHGEVKIF
ncbi:MAG: YigZ family protein [Lachnospiraceae bacterium]|nr:YigZ family protein [Lachnospiraceae bacterium]